MFVDDLFFNAVFLQSVLAELDHFHQKVNIEAA